MSTQTAPPPGAVTMSPGMESLLARCDFPQSRHELDVAVSGGPDSLALLALSCAAGCAVTAYHVDHGVRVGSGEDARVVEEAARRFGARFVALEICVEPGPNLEARMRDERRRVLPRGIATGHTADDQAETILLNVLRGAGMDGLSGMTRGREHPILALRRRETHALCAELGLDPVVDPSNVDPSFRRNRVRHEVLPLLDEIAGRDVAGLMARQGELIAADAALLDDLARAIDPTDTAALCAAPLPLARRAIRMWLASYDPRGYVPGSAAVERVLEVVHARAVGCEVGGGVSVRRRAGRLRIEREFA